MTSPGQLVPGRRWPRPLRLEPAGVEAAGLLGPIWRRVGAPHEWMERAARRDEEWAAELGKPEIRTYVAWVDREVAGFTVLGVEAGGSVGILYFGLVPEFVGRGFGGDFLTQVTRLAWSFKLRDGSSPQRVWLQTADRDHPSALPNYEARGFRVFARERRRLPGA